MKKRIFRGRPANFSQKEIDACLDKKLDSNLYKNYSRCHKCGLSPEKLIWIEFTSPPWTWKARCGLQGPLSLCPACGIQVEIIVKVRS
ncbi:MAG: hypothetical protein BWY70_01125 [Bacteroidetes bacterium ADurb.Bin408]|nr:MAG: hypothetical protein BWY70_01125 [Bacteroidetes bacterium ADurb.Bin408]